MKSVHTDIGDYLNTAQEPWASLTLFQTKHGSQILQISLLQSQPFHRIWGFHVGPPWTVDISTLNDLAEG